MVKKSLDEVLEIIPSLFEINLISDKDGNVTDMENLMKDAEPVVRDYYNKCKEEFINNDRETSTN